MIGRIIFGLIGISLGLLITIKARWIVERITGPIKFAEKFFSSGGTYVFLGFFGIFLVISSALIMFGVGGFIYDAIAQGLSGIFPK